MHTSASYKLKLKHQSLQNKDMLVDNIKQIQFSISISLLKPFALLTWKSKPNVRN
jgi:hypothetical protein